MPGHPQGHQQAGHEVSGATLAVLHMPTQGPGLPSSWVKLLTPLCAGQMLAQKENVGPGPQTLLFPIPRDPV